MKDKKKNSKIIYILLGIPLCIALVFWCYIIFIIADAAFRFDFSQDYRKIAGIENVVFQRNGTHDRFYERCFWGLRKTDAPAEFKEYEEYAEIPEKEILQEYIGDNFLRQAVTSPDGNYILYCEIKYGYRNFGVSDDEYCYYRVFDIKTKEIITIYEAYREWYNLDWQ